MTNGAVHPDGAGQRPHQKVVSVDAVLEIASHVKSFDRRSVVIVADAGVIATGYVDKLVGALSEPEIVVLTIPSGEPTIASINDVAESVRTIHSPIIVGVGGGSAIDTAKLASVVSLAEMGVEHYLLDANPFAGRHPILAVPTTSGTGAEATRTCVLSNNDGRKLWARSDELLPDVVMLDASAATTMPKPVTVGTGLDAFVHGMEASTAIRADESVNEPARHDALKALQLIHQALPNAVLQPSSLAARAVMQEAAFLAGRATDSCGTGIAHAIGHALGSLYHVPHGVAVAIGLHASLEWSVEGSADSYVDVGRSLGVDVQQVPTAFEQLLQRTDFSTIAKLQPAHRIDALAIAATMVAEENFDTFRNNCRPATDEDRFYLAQRTVASWEHLRA